MEKETEVFLAPDVGLLVMIGSNLNNEIDGSNIKCGNRKCHFVILIGTDMINTNKNEQTQRIFILCAYKFAVSNELKWNISL